MSEKVTVSEDELDNVQGLTFSEVDMSTSVLCVVGILKVCHHPFDRLKQ